MLAEILGSRINRNKRGGAKQKGAAARNTEQEAR